ncbi:hypothetical protein NP493_681g01045 [Ridgeia piscesae]|uniref:Uncharacterized protein n=1 Tax=Ridgeia piscesae TaxID=27915 RepID=A0AAD9KRT0_RIDPI|nr:hypothetical protein NP493_681g01045 [Ridgeia piscesae]
MHTLFPSPGQSCVSFLLANCNPLVVVCRCKVVVSEDGHWPVSMCYGSFCSAAFYLENHCNRNPPHLNCPNFLSSTFVNQQHCLHVLYTALTFQYHEIVTTLILCNKSVKIVGKDLYECKMPL